MQNNDDVGNHDALILGVHVYIKHVQESMKLCYNPVH
jgi:hypothetical protein